MLGIDLIGFSLRAAVAHRLRSVLTALGIGIGVAAVILLTSLGEGLRQYVVSQFTQFGTNIIAINPGKASTMGMSPGIFASVRPLTLEDAEALERLPYVEAVVPSVQGNGEVEARGRSRRTLVLGVGERFPEAFGFAIQQGEFLPPEEIGRSRSLAVLGAKMKQELFPGGDAVGQRVRISGNRFRVIGVMEPKGEMLGFDLDDAIYIPAGKGLELFNREALQEIDILYSEAAVLEELVAGIKRVLVNRHGGEDFTITTQQQMMDVLGSVLNVLTLGVGALGGISLIVGGVGIFTIMTIAVAERTREIGLLRALGSQRSRILGLFLAESMLLSALGGAAGVLLGAGFALFLSAALPGLPVRIAYEYVLAAMIVAVVIGLVAGVLPARRAANMEPLEALRAE